jgi:hypothetical protein
MADENNNPPSREEIGRFELTRPVQWEQAALRGIGQIGMLVALSLDVDPGWLIRVEHDPRWATHYAPLLAERDRRVQLLAQLLKRRKPRFEERHSHALMFEPDEREPYIRELIDARCTVPQQMRDALAGVISPTPPAPAQPAYGGAMPLKPKRPYPLDAEIAEAMRRAPDSNDHNSVYGELVKMAEVGFGVLVGYSSDGVRYLGKQFEETGEPDVFTRKRLYDRMRTARNRAKANEAERSGTN